MRLLFLTSRLPYPPNRGDRLRTYHLLRQLSQEHKITLVSFASSQEEANLSQHLADFTEEIHLIMRPKTRSQITTIANIWRSQPLQSLYYRSNKMQKLIDRLLAEQDYGALYVHLFRMAPYVAGKPGLYRIVDLTDMISSEIAASLPYRSKISRLIYQLEEPRMAAYESQVAGWAEETWLISERDCAKLAAVQPSANIKVVPNGVDLHRFYPKERESSSKKLLFVGHLDVFHNIDAVSYLLEEIFPLVHRRFPDATLDIVGPGTGVSRAAVEQVQGASFMGFVDDLNQALNQADIFVAPLRFSAGVQNKVLEAMAAGLPVVTTPNVNEGLAGSPGSDLLLGDSADALANAIISLLENKPLRRQIGQAGRQLVAQNFTWEIALTRLRKIQNNPPHP